MILKRSILFFFLALPLLAASGNAAFAQILPPAEQPLMSLPPGSQKPVGGCPPGGLAAAAPALSAPAETAPAQEAEESIGGVPVIQEANLIIVGGHIVSLWGIDALAPDQKCWQGDAAWDCGQQATIFLRHFVEGWAIGCTVKEKPKDSPLLVRCYRQKDGENEKDIGETLVRLGWALNNPAAEGSPYAEAEAEAKEQKRGVWGSRFQTAKDWEEGVQRFMGDTQEPPAATPDK